MIKQLASAVLWAIVGLAAPADDLDAWADDSLDESGRQEVAEIRSITVLGLPLADGEERPVAWVARKSDRPLAVAAVGDGPQPFVAEMQVAFLSIAEPEIGRELMSRGLAQARERGALKVLIDPGVMPPDQVSALAEANGFHFYRSRMIEGATQLEFLIDLYWRGFRAKT